MSPDRGEGTSPPRFLRALVRVLIRGSDAPFIVSDLDASFARDVERGLGRGRATRRYAWNVLASVWSVWTSALRRIVTHGLGLDAKLGLRMLAKQPLITAVAVLALGLGIPASLTLLHGMNVLFSDLPVPDGHRVVGVRHYDVEGQNPLPSSMLDFEGWQAIESFESLGAVRSFSVNINAEESGAPPVRAAEITASSFDILRARPLLGRLLDPADERDGAPNVLLIGEELWDARFARDPGIVGQTIRIGRTPFTVVGVMPADFRFPSSDQVWLPLRAHAADSPVGGGPQMMVFGRIADGVSFEAARAEMTGLTASRASDDPERFERLMGEVVGMATLLLNEDAENTSLWSHTEILILQALIFGLLLVVCGNVGALILARTAARSNEITIRTALGASRARILTQLFVEALVLAMVATGLGLLLTHTFARWLMRVLTPYDLLPYWVDLTLTPRFVGIALGLAVLCAAVAGLLPALSSTRRAIQANLQRTSARSGGTRFGIGSSVLIVSQIILSVGFLALGARGVRTAFAYQGDELGFDPDRYVYATLTVPELDAMEVQQAHVEEIQRTLLTRLSEDPAVVGVASGAHVSGLSSPNGDVILETPPAGFDPVEWNLAIARVDVAFFTGLRRPILAGRDFNAGDVEGPPGTRPTAVIVNESFVRHYFGGRSAVGQRFRYQPPMPAWRALDEEEWYEIVGVVGSFGTNPENSARDAAIYHPLAPGQLNPVRFTVEVAGDPEAFLPRFRQIAASVDPVATVSTGLLAATIRTDSLIFRATFLLVLALAGAAFLLSATGLYALMSFTISQRTREIGIRTALGASTTDIVSAVAGRAALQIGVGLALGVAWGWLVLHNSRNDVEVGNIPLTLALTVVIAGSVCVAACAHPTLRGLRIQPTEALSES